jgi:hypothetical protein
MVQREMWLPFDVQREMQLPFVQFHEGSQFRELRVAV